MRFLTFLSRKHFFFNSPFFKKFASYSQGQVSESGIREYFYYVNHEGWLFLDDAKIKNFTSCFKDKMFLHFFFTRVKANDTDRYKEDFPFLSICGRERNYVRCDDLPIVFTQIVKDKDGKEKLSCAHAGELLTVDFQPNKIYMSPKTGRVYHPAWEKVGKIGLVRCKLAMELSKSLNFSKGEDYPPTHFTRDGVKYKLCNDWVKETILGNKLC